MDVRHACNVTTEVVLLHALSSGRRHYTRAQLSLALVATAYFNRIKRVKRSNTPYQDNQELRS